MKRTIIFSLAALLAACSSSDISEDLSGAAVHFNAGAELEGESFFDFPWPSDLRLDETGTPALAGFPNPKNNEMVRDLVSAAADRQGFSVLPVAYFRFAAPPAPQSPDTVIPAAPSSPVLLVDVDPDSPERGRLIPTVAWTPEPDTFLPENVLAVAARPGFVLHGNRTYAFVVMRSLNDAKGKRLGVPPILDDLRDGRTPTGKHGAGIKALYAPLWSALDKAGVSRDGVAAATVFTTGDTVARVADVSERLASMYEVEITGLAVDTDDGNHPATTGNPGYCELHGTVTYPQFQRGKAPFDKGGDAPENVGRFVWGDDGLPVKQSDEEAPVVITIPKTAMPATGYPLTMYFHGSGGLSTQVVDRGTVTEIGGDPIKGGGPSLLLAPFGIATAGSAMPVNPERLNDPEASDIAYLNLGNVGAFPYTFQQGVIEQRMFIAALRELRIPPEALAGCDAPALPEGEDAYFFEPETVLAMGQSMGGMYTNMIGAVDPIVKAVVPTGAGGFWGYFILETSLIPGAANLLSVILNTGTLTFLHPTMSLLELAWEAAEPMVYVPRLAYDPLPGHPARPIYEPVGKGDSYFPIQVLDAMALAYGNEQAGDEIWPGMQEALALDGREGILPYPVSDNRSSLADDLPYTGVVVQFKGDGIYDPHAVAFQLDEVKYQYSCFFDTFLRTGIAQVLAPRPLGSPCE